MFDYHTNVKTAWARDSRVISLHETNDFSGEGECRGFVSTLSRRESGLYPKPFRVRFVEDMAGMGQVFMVVPPRFPVSAIQPITSATNSIVK
jgi:hypothetical protein